MHHFIVPGRGVVYLLYECSIFLTHVNALVVLKCFRNCPVFNLTVILYH